MDDMIKLSTIQEKEFASNDFHCIRIWIANDTLPISGWDPLTFDTLADYAFDHDYTKMIYQTGNGGKEVQNFQISYFAQNCQV